MKVEDVRDFLFSYHEISEHPIYVCVYVCYRPVDYVLLYSYSYHMNENLSDMYLPQTVYTKQNNSRVNTLGIKIEN